MTYIPVSHTRAAVPGNRNVNLQSMKESITTEVHRIFTQSRNWLELQVEYTKLTTAEKATIMTSTFVLGAVCLLLGMVVMILLSLALADVFKMFMAPALAYLSVSGVLVILIVLLYIFRRVTLYNPIARYMTRLLLGGGNAAQKEEPQEK